LLRKGGGGKEEICGDKTPNLQWWGVKTKKAVRGGESLFRGKVHIVVITCGGNRAIGEGTWLPPDSPF